VFQDFRLLPNKTVAQNVAFALQVIGKPRHTIAQVVPETLELVGLQGKEGRLPHELSGGEQQRVAIARAFVNRPAILLADEPTGNLDPTTSLEIMRLLDRINRTGTTILMATHDDDIVNQLRKRVVELEDGRVVRDEPVGVYDPQR
jgi:cell division transport system ATP-binding protein